MQSVFMFSLFVIICCVARISGRPAQSYKGVPGSSTKNAVVHPSGQAHILSANISEIKISTKQDIPSDSGNETISDTDKPVANLGDNDTNKNTVVVKAEDDKTDADKNSVSVVSPTLLFKTNTEKNQTNIITSTSTTSTPVSSKKDASKSTTTTSITSTTTTTTTTVPSKSTTTINVTSTQEGGVSASPDDPAKSVVNNKAADGGDLDSVSASKGDNTRDPEHDAEVNKKDEDPEDSAGIPGGETNADKEIADNIGDSNNNTLGTSKTENIDSKTDEDTNEEDEESDISEEKNVVTVSSDGVESVTEAIGINVDEEAYDDVINTNLDINGEDLNNPNDNALTENDINSYNFEDDGKNSEDDVVVNNEKSLNYPDYGDARIDFPDVEKEGKGHFFAFILTAMFCTAALYLLYHNKRKVIALVLPGNQRRTGMRHRGPNYERLENKSDGKQYVF